MVQSGTAPTCHVHAMIDRRSRRPVGALLSLSDRAKGSAGVNKGECEFVGLRLTRVFRPR